MTREEEIIEAASKYSEYEFNECAVNNGFIKGAQWADEHPKPPKVETLLWVARDKDGWLRLFQTKPERDYESWEGGDYFYLRSDEFPEVKWEDGPIEVALVRINKDYKK